MKDELLVRHVDALRESVARVRESYPFVILGWVVLPDHFHCVISLPENDDRFDLRWRLIKQHFSKQVPRTERLPATRQRRGERGLWQRRYWEHVIRDERDLRAHLDYVHMNPVKHGLASRALDWPYSTLHRLVRAGIYPSDWAAGSIDPRLTHVGRISRIAA